MTHHSLKQPATPTTNPQQLTHPTQHQHVNVVQGTVHLSTNKGQFESTWGAFTNGSAMDGAIDLRSEKGDLDDQPIPWRIHGILVYLPTWMVDLYGKCMVNIPYMDGMGST